MKSRRRWYPPTVALSKPTASVELRVTSPYETEQYELEIFHIDDNVVKVSRHDSVEDAQRFAAERIGVEEIAWTVVDRERLMMRPEVGAESPLWTVSGDMVGLDGLPLDPALRARLQAWADVAWEQDDPVLYAEGQALLREVARQLADAYEVVWDDD